METNFDYLTRINHILKSPKIEEIRSSFHDDGYIRLNMIYINPIVLLYFKKLLIKTGMIDWELKNNGLYFIYKEFVIVFKGSPEFYGDDRIFGVDLDFQPSLSSSLGEEVLVEIETYLKGCDTIFFMTYFVDVDSEILRNPLVPGLEYLEKRIGEKQGSIKKW